MPHDRMPRQRNITSVIFFFKDSLPESDNEETLDKHKLKEDGIQKLQDYGRQKTENTF